MVDLWGGYKDVDRKEPWQPDTIVIMNSLAKSMCALSLHILIDRGKVDFDAPVADYWPEFAQAGKKGVLIRHILSHTCGVIYCDRATPGSWYRWDEHIKRAGGSRSRPGSPALTARTIRSTSAI